MGRKWLQLIVKNPRQSRKAVYPAEIGTFSVSGSGVYYCFFIQFRTTDSFHSKEWLTPSSSAVRGFSFSLPPNSFLLHSLWVSMGPGATEGRIRKEIGDGGKKDLVLLQWFSVIPGLCPRQKAAVGPGEGRLTCLQFRAFLCMLSPHCPRREHMRALRHGGSKCIALVHSYRVVEWASKPRPLHESQASYQIPSLLADLCLPSLPPNLLCVFEHLLCVMHCSGLRGYRCDQGRHKESTRRASSGPVTTLFPMLPTHLSIRGVTRLYLCYVFMYQPFPWTVRSWGRSKFVTHLCPHRAWPEVGFMPV